MNPIISVFLFNVLPACIFVAEPISGFEDGTRIHASHEAIPYGYPYAVFMDHLDGYRGQGVILDPWTVLLDPRLGAGTRGQKVDFIVIAGRHKTKTFSPTEQTREACSASLHPKYNDANRQHGYQLVHLSDPFVFNEYVSSIAMAPAGFVPTPIQTCTVLSRGPVNQTVGYPAPHLQEAATNVLKNSQCPSITEDHPTIACSDSNFCSYDDGAALICTKDLKTYLYGLSLHGYADSKCGERKQTIYSNVANIDRAWLNSEVTKAMSASTCGDRWTTNENEPADDGTLIEGGTEATPHSYRFIVVMKTFSQGTSTYICTGFIYDKYTVFTSLTCYTLLKALDLRKIRVVAGAHDLRKREITMQTRAICKMSPFHEDLNQPANRVNSYAMLHLNDPFDLNENVGAIHLPPSPLPDVTECMVPGWGYWTPNNFTRFDVLRHRSVEILSAKQCNNPAWEHDSQLCTTGVICNGDLGAPLVCTANNREFVLGIGVWGEDGVYCGQQKKALFAALLKMDTKWFADRLEAAEKECRPFHFVKDQL